MKTLWWGSGCNGCTAHWLSLCPYGSSLAVPAAAAAACVHALQLGRLRAAASARLARYACPAHPSPLSSSRCRERGELHLGAFYYPCSRPCSRPCLHTRPPAAV